MAKRFILSIDQGTTGTRVILFNHEGLIHSMAYREIHQIYPKPGWVEQNAMKYWETSVECSHEAMEKGNVEACEIAAIGITCQR